MPLGRGRWLPLLTEELIGWLTLLPNRPSGLISWIRSLPLSFGKPRKFARSHLFSWLRLRSLPTRPAFMVLTIGGKSSRLLPGTPRALFVLTEHPSLKPALRGWRWPTFHPYLLPMPRMGYTLLPVLVPRLLKPAAKVSHAVGVLCLTLS